MTCLDWKLQVAGPLPSNIECLSGDFMSMDLAPNAYDSIIAADVFEHVLLEERDTYFVRKCLAASRPGGNLVISVPHQGTFAYLLQSLPGQTYNTSCTRARRFVQRCP